MTLKNLLEETYPFHARRTNKATRVYINPTDKELEKLKSTLGGHDIRYIAYMPNSNRKYLYIWNAGEALHVDVMDEFSIPESATEDVNKVQYGYGDFRKGRLNIQDIHHSAGKEWDWLRNYKGESNLKEEKQVMRIPTHKGDRIAKIYINPTQEDINELENSFDENRLSKSVRFAAYAPDEERHYLYVWSSMDAYHEQIIEQFGLPTHYNVLQTGYGSIVNGRLHFDLHLRTDGKWSWLKKYSVK